MSGTSKTLALKSKTGSQAELIMRTKVPKWRNRLAVRIPKPIIEGGAVGLAPPRREYTLEEFVRGITPENRHAEVDLGPPAGREIL